MKLQLQLGEGPEESALSLCVCVCVCLYNSWRVYNCSVDNRFCDIKKAILTRLTLVVLQPNQQNDLYEQFSDLPPAWLRYGYI